MTGSSIPGVACLGPGRTLVASPGPLILPIFAIPLQYRLICFLGRGYCVDNCGSIPADKPCDSPHGESPISRYSADQCAGLANLDRAARSSAYARKRNAHFLADGIRKRHELSAAFQDLLPGLPDQRDFVWCKLYHAICPRNGTALSSGRMSTITPPSLHRSPNS